MMDGLRTFHVQLWVAATSNAKLPGTLIENNLLRTSSQDAPEGKFDGSVKGERPGLWLRKAGREAFPLFLVGI